MSTIVTFLRIILKIKTNWIKMKTGKYFFILADAFRNLNVSYQKKLPIYRKRLTQKRPFPIF